MKKLTCMLLCAVFAFGSLMLFAGCKGLAITDEDKKAKVLAALDDMEVPAFELSMETHTTASKNGGEYNWSEAESKQSVSVVAYEEDGKIYGDMLMDTYQKSAYRLGYKWGTFRDSSSTYDLSFARGDAVYTAEGSWEDMKVEAGDFDALLKNYLTSAKPLIVKDNSSDFEAEDVEKYAALAALVQSRVYMRKDGYRVEYDLIKGVAGVYERLAQAAEYYVKNPDITVAELFEAAQMAGLEDAVFLSDEYSERPASELFGEPEKFRETLRRALDDPELFLLENLFGYTEGKDNKASFTCTLTIDLNFKLDFKRLDLDMDLDIDMLSETGETKTRTEVDAMIKLTVNALSKSPSLRDLTDMHAQTRRPVANEYDFSVDDVWLSYIEDNGWYIQYGTLQCSVSGHVVVDDAGVATFNLQLVSCDDDGHELINESGAAAIDLIHDVDYGDATDRTGKATFYKGLKVTLARGRVGEMEEMTLTVSFVGSNYYVELSGHESAVLEMNAILEIITL